MKNKTIVLCGGGTAGHVMPNVALLPDLEKTFSSIHYIGGNGIEKQIISKISNVTYHQICTEKLRRSLSPKNLTLPFKLTKGVFQAKKILKELKPNVIFSKGGFASLPVCIAGKLLKIPIITHESDFSIGLANKLIYPLSTKFFCTFKSTASFGKKCEYSGNIIRRQIFDGNKNIVQQKYNLNVSKPTLLVFGGSLGSAKINNVVFECANDICKNFNVLHICGRGKTNNSIKLANYHQIEFENSIQNLFAASDYVISRAGSNAIFELLALKKPMLLIPLSSGRGDQIQNAKEFEKNGYALVLEEQNLNAKTLLGKIDALKSFQFPKNANFQMGNEIILKNLSNL